MPPKAEVAIIEDNRIIRTFFKKALTAEGHNVVTNAGTFEEAQALIHQLGHLKVEVVLMDGNLSEEERSGRDGARLTEEIHVAYPDIKVIGISGHPDGVAGVDLNVSKTDIILGDVNLGKIITNI